MSQPELFNILGGLGGAIGGIAAAIAVVYSSLQLRSTIKQSVSQTLIQFNGIFDELEKSQERNSYRNHGFFVVRYLNHCEHLSYLRYRDMIDENTFKYFDTSLLAGRNLLSMKEYEGYSKEYPYFWYYYEAVNPKTKYKVLPPENIRIMKLTDAQSVSAISPPKLQINPYELAVWKNMDTRSHKIMSTKDSLESFDSGDDGPHSLKEMGDTFAHMFTKCGDFSYYCTLHAGETGSIKVCK